MSTNTTSVRLKMSYKTAVVFCFLLFSRAQAHAQSHQQLNNFLLLVKNYADVFVENGRDEYGEVHSPLFDSVLNRETMKIEPEIASITIPGGAGA